MRHFRTGRPISGLARSNRQPPAPAALERAPFRCGMAWSLPYLPASSSRGLDCVPFRDGVRERVGDQVKLAATMELYAYWNRLRAARSAPERNDVDPGAIRGVLADTFMLDFDAKRGFPFRIAGLESQRVFHEGAEGPFLSGALAGRRSRRTRFGSALRRGRSAGVPHRRRGASPRSGRGGHRGHSAAASPSRIDAFPRPGRIRRPCRARVDRPHGRGTDRAHLAARARFAASAPARCRRRARRRPASRFARRPSATSTCLSIPATAPRLDVRTGQAA